MSTFLIHKLNHSAFTLLLEQIAAGDRVHAAAPHAFVAEDRAQLESDLAAWKGVLNRVVQTEKRYDEAKQTRDEAAEHFRNSVRPAREWVKGTFPRGDERPGEYGLDLLPPRTWGKMLTYGRFLIQANTQEPPLEPTLPDRLLTPIQNAFVELQASILAYQAAGAGRIQATAERNTLRKEVEARTRSLRQRLYTYVSQDNPLLADYGLR